MKDFEHVFFTSSWPRTLCVEGSKVEFGSDFGPNEKSEIVYASLVPSIDTYISRYQIPTIRNPDEDEEQFLARVCQSMYELNQRNLANKGWKDCWLSTAIEIGRANCALGSLILARALEISGFAKEELEFGMPGPMTHAVVIAKGQYYVDQTNGVIVKVVDGGYVGGIKTFQVVENDDAEIMYKVPFRRIPVCAITQGTAPLIWNMSVMLEEKGKDADELLSRFHLDSRYSYEDWARDNLLGPDWSKQNMWSRREWVEERRLSKQLLES